MAPVSAVPSRRSAHDAAPGQCGEDPGPKLLVDLNLMAPRPARPSETTRLQQQASTERTRECETCERRKYQDGSDDPSVSFQTPAHLSPAEAETMVRVHEQEHVQHERAAATREGKQVETRVSIHYSTCPECGRVYCSGGTTHVETREPAGPGTDPASSASPAPAPVALPSTAATPPANAALFAAGPTPAVAAPAVDLVA